MDSSGWRFWQLTDCWREAPWGGGSLRPRTCGVSPPLPGVGGRWLVGVDSWRLAVGGSWQLVSVGGWQMVVPGGCPAGLSLIKRSGFLMTAVFHAQMGLRAALLMQGSAHGCCFCPLCPHASAGNASHSVIPKTVKFGGCAPPHLMREK